MAPLLHTKPGSAGTCAKICHTHRQDYNDTYSSLSDLYRDLESSIFTKREIYSKKEDIVKMQRDPPKISYLYIHSTLRHITDYRNFHKDVSSILLSKNTRRKIEKASPSANVGAV
jgi:hypothetical protein